MTLINKLPRDEDEPIYIKIPVAGMTNQGEHMEGFTTEEYLRRTFGDELMDAELPLSDDQFNSLLDKGTPMWKLNWVEMKKQGILN